MRLYSETRDASAELLRIILPQLAAHEAGFHPISYALWYEYSAGINPALKAEIDEILASGQRLNDNQVWTLFEKHISCHDDANSLKLRAELERMLITLTQTTSSTGAQVSAYSKSLDGFGEQLKSGTTPEQLKVALQTVLDQTGQMNSRTRELETQLQDSSREVENLRTELTRAKGEALTDPLTTIANRRGFVKAIDNFAAAQSEGLGGSCLIMLDIDHFKKCNDTYGHLFGDKVIRNVALILKKMIKGQDTAARIGGEEFVVFLPDTPMQGALKLAEQIRATVAAGLISDAVNNVFGKITISLGVTHFVLGDTLESYMARADKALYASKASGRDRVTALHALNPTARGASALASAASVNAPVLQ